MIKSEANFVQVHAMFRELRRVKSRAPAERNHVMKWITFGLLTTAWVSAGEWQRPPGWTATKGGEGGQVIEVTTLSPTGKGSLSEALGAKGARTIVFKVGGVIDLAGRRLKISNPQLTIAGETAPAPGITLIKGGLSISADDVIVRHLRVRPGENGKAKKSGWEVDAITTNASANVIVDHCSITWATDENLSASGPRHEGETPDDWRRSTSHRITFSHCIIGEGLKDSTHRKGAHSMGSLIHDNVSDVLIYGNLYISNNDRNPLFKGGARGAVVNNLIHNPGLFAFTYSLSEREWEGHAWERGAVAVTGNVLRQGQDTRRSSFARLRGPGDFWFSDNLVIDKQGVSQPPKLEITGLAGKPSTVEEQKIILLDKAPKWPEGLTARPASESTEWVLENAGARPWDRDATDRRLVAEARSGTGKIINSESEVGGY